MTSEAHKPPDKGLDAWLAQLAIDYIKSPASFMHTSHGAEPSFDPPIFGIAAGDDPMWPGLKDSQVVASFHLTPLEAFKLAFPLEQTDAGDLSVFCWVLPQTKATMEDNARETRFPAERWAYARIEGEAVGNTGLRKHLLMHLEKRGIKAVAPVITPGWQQLSDEMESPSNWSERHAAHIAGLGTFGLCDGLITKKGKAHRVGSLVVKHKMPPTAREYSHYQEYCPYFSSGGACGVCIKRCPVGAISASGHDKHKCAQYLFGATVEYVKERWPLENGYGCGLCQTKVPCARGIPGGAQ